MRTYPRGGINQVFEERSYQLRANGLDIVECDLIRRPHMCQLMLELFIFNESRYTSYGKLHFDCEHMEHGLCLWNLWHQGEVVQVIAEFTLA